MPNRLINTSSPYLLQHADNPVDWHPWDEVALQKARTEDKPIFLSIGYAACHWCHVMAHESFEDPATAEILNSYFVSIKVDREERPDLDSIYMDAVVAIAGQGGWPMSVFLTPEGKPFHGGTYFPPTRRYNLPSFKEVLLAIAQAWQQDRASLSDHADNLLEYLRVGTGLAKDTQTLHLPALEKAANALIQEYDWLSGGWGKAPKFPQPQLIEFLLRCAVRGKHRPLDAAVHALTAMAKGGMFDLVGGGFARYSTDAQWLVPHFEKMLYDNALLSRAYLHAYLITGDVGFRKICEQTLDFILNEMTHPGGGFYSSLDADSEGDEGKYYLWTQAEIASILEPAGLSALFMRAFAITEQGNFEGKNIIRRAIDTATLSAEFHIELSEVEQSIDQALRLLHRARSSRIRPATDDKIILIWNALTLTAFAEAGRFLERDDYLDVAMRNYTFLATNLLTESGFLVRSWRNYKSVQPAFLEDYAALILGILALYQARPDQSLYQAAHKLTSTMLGLFKGEDSPVLFDTSNQHTDIILRPKSFQDGATPSGASLAAEALLKMAALSGNTDWRDHAVQAIESVARTMIDHPTAFGNWLCVTDYALGPALEIALIGDPQEQTYHELKRVLDQVYLPNTLLASTALPASADSPELLHNRPLHENKPTAYVCQNFTCKLPTNRPDELRRQVDDYRAVLKSQPGNQLGD